MKKIEVIISTYAFELSLPEPIQQKKRPIAKTLRITGFPKIKQRA